MAQAVSHRLHAVEVGVQYGMWWKNGHWGRFFSEYFGFDPVIIIPPRSIVSSIADSQW